MNLLKPPVSHHPPHSTHLPNGTNFITAAGEGFEPDNRDRFVAVPPTKAASNAVPRRLNSERAPDSRGISLSKGASETAKVIAEDARNRPQPLGVSHALRYPFSISSDALRKQTAIGLNTAAILLPTGGTPSPPAIPVSFVVFVFRRTDR